VSLAQRVKEVIDAREAAKPGDRCDVLNRGREILVPLRVFQGRAPPERHAKDSKSLVDGFVHYREGGGRPEMH